MIIDSGGQACYEVRSVPDIAERLSLRAAGGGELAAVVRDVTSGGFGVLIAGESAALVRARGLIRRQYLIDAPGGSLSVLGDAYGGTYVITTSTGAGTAPQVQVRRQAAASRSRASYEVSVAAADEADPVRLTAIVLGIEYLCEDRRTSMDELKIGASVLRGLLGLGLRR